MYFKIGHECFFAQTKALDSSSISIDGLYKFNCESLLLHVKDCTEVQKMKILFLVAWFFDVRLVCLPFNTTVHICTYANQHNPFER